MGVGAEGTQPSGGCVRTLLIDNYDSYTYNLYQMIASVNGMPPIVIMNDELDGQGLEGLIQREGIDNIVISPGPGTPHKPDDAGISLEVFERCRNMPVFGVCFGFQSLCLFHGGGRVVKAPEPVHGRISVVHHNQEDALFDNIPSSFQVVRYHSLCVQEESLDSSVCAPLAWSSTGDSRILMAVKHTQYPHYGVQFHPESVATEYGSTLLDNFRKLTILHHQGNNGDLLGHKTVEPCPLAIESAPSLNKTLHLYQRKLRGKLADFRDGAAELVEALFVQGGKDENLFWLDSSTSERTRFSFFGSTGGNLWRRISYNLDRGDGSGTLTVWSSDGTVVCQEECTSIFDWITRETSTFTEFDDAFGCLPFDFWGGLVGYLGYELKCQTGGRAAHRSPNADSCFFIVDRFVAIDHKYNDIYIIAVYADESNDAEDSREWVDRMADAVEQVEECTTSFPVSDTRHGVHFVERHHKHAYQNKIEQCLEALFDGDSYELCLTNMLSTVQEHVDALPLYNKLRRVNPAPYSAYMDFSKCIKGPKICCSSPERFLSGTRNGRLEAKPIKGTARRDLADSSNDARIADCLYHSEKDRAENLMIVDLLRNDLGKVCETGSVEVTGLMQIETFATVHQMVSTIIGRRKQSVGIGDIVKACFPGGSMTGAPKIRSMEILDTLEEGPRGIYSGSIGYFSWNQAFDLNIVIRTAIINGHDVLIGAGGAIVVQSDPEGEYLEMKLKAEPLINSFTYM